METSPPRTVAGASAGGAAPMAAMSLPPPPASTPVPAAQFIWRRRQGLAPSAARGSVAPSVSKPKRTSSTAQRPPASRVCAVETAAISPDAGVEVNINDAHHVFAQMPTSKEGGRSTNYSVQEDEALVLAWENVSIDPVIGVDQSSKTYWKRIADHFHWNVKTPSGRSIKSLSHRWSSIQECCNRWAGCLEQIDRCPPSGSTIQDRINHTQELYKMRELKNRSFMMMCCWTMLEHNEKWIRRNEDSHPLRKTSSKPSSPDEGTCEADEENGRNDTPSSAVLTKKRPPGRKQEKERLKKGGDAAVF